MWFHWEMPCTYMTIPTPTIFNWSRIFSQDLSNHEKPLSSGRSYETWDLGTVGLFLALPRTLTWSEGGRKEKRRRKRRYNSFSLFMVVMFYKVTTNWTSEYPTIAPGGNTGLGSREPLVTTFSSTDQCITLFYLCSCLKTPYLTYIVDSLALNSQPAAL